MELTREGEAEYCIEKFLEAKKVSDKRRGEKTKTYTRAIINCLSKQFEIDNQKPDIKKEDIGWVVCSNLLEDVRTECSGVPESTFYRILGELKGNHLIEHGGGKTGKPIKPRRPGKPPVYYRVPALHARAWFDSKEDLILLIVNLINTINRDVRIMRAARSLLKQCHQNDPKYNVGKDLFLESMRILEMEKKKN